MKMYNFRQKALLIGLLLILSTCYFVISCNEKIPITDLTLADFEQIGTLHNEGLDFVLGQLVEDEIDKQVISKDLKKAYALTLEASINFSSNSFDLSNSDNGKLTQSLGKVDFNFESTAKGDYITTLMQREINLSERQTRFFYELDRVLNNTDLDLEQILDEICGIEQEIMKQCSYEELNVLLSATSVGKKSLEYWKENFETWSLELIDMSLGKSEDDREWFWETIKNMGKSDLVGAGIGAGVGAFAGGVGAAPGAVAGACYSSAGRGIVAILDRLEVW